MKSPGILLAVLAFCSTAQPQTDCSRLKEIHRVLRVGLRLPGSLCRKPVSLSNTNREWAARSFYGKHCVGDEIALYPEYTGTIDEEILKTKQPLSTDEMRALLRQEGRWHDRGAWFQQHLRASHAARSCCQTRYPHRSATSANHPELNIGLTLRIPRPPGWLGAAQCPLRLTDAKRAWDGPRPWLTLRWRLAR